MTEKEQEEILKAAVRRTIVAHPGLSPEGIADMIAGKQQRDPREAIPAARAAAQRIIDGIPKTRNTPENEEELAGEVADQGMLDLDYADISALAWLCTFNMASRLLSQ